MDVTHRRCMALTVKLSIGLLPASTRQPGLSPCQDSGFLLTLHGLFHLPFWLASSSWLFPSIKWGESTVFGSRFSILHSVSSKKETRSLEAVSSWEKADCRVSGCRGGPSGATLLRCYVWKLRYQAAGRCTRYRKKCSVVFPCT